MAGDEAMTESRVARLEEGVDSLKEGMRHVTNKLEEVALYMSSLVRVEEKNSLQANDISRAFREIDQAKASIRELEICVAENKSKTDKWIYGGVGAGVAFTVFWAIVQGLPAILAAIS